jgi:hypothetical protein
MRYSSKALLAVAAALSIALAGCDSSGKTGASPSKSGGTSGSSTSSGGPTGGAAGGTAASCVVGTWKSTSSSGQLNNSGVTGTIQGGGGFTLKISSDGGAVVNFDGMQPAVFTFAVAGGEIKGQFVYGGQVKGTLRMPAGNNSSGTWEPVGSVDFGSLTVTVDVTKPVQARVADKVPIAQFVGTDTAQTGNAVDGQPILKPGTYKCEGNKLLVGPPTNTTGVSWVFEKA